LEKKGKGRNLIAIKKEEEAGRKGKE